MSGHRRALEKPFKGFSGIHCRSPETARGLRRDQSHCRLHPGGWIRVTFPRRDPLTPPHPPTSAHMSPESQWLDLMALQPWGLGFSIWVWLPTALPVRASCSRLTEPIEGSARLQPPACISSCTRSRGLLGRRPPGGGGQQAGVDRRGQRRRTRRKRRVSTGRSRKREGVCLLKPKACPTLGPGSLLSAWNPPGKIPGVCARPSSRGSSSRELLLR